MTTATLTTATLEEQTEPTFSFSLGNGQVEFQLLKTNNQEIATGWLNSLLEKPANQLSCKHRGKEIPIEEMKKLLGLKKQK